MPKRKSHPKHAIPGGPKRGRPVYIPTKKTRGGVAALAAFGTPQPIIAEHYGISVDTLTKYYADEISGGLPRANAKVAQSLFNRATDKTGRSGNVVAAIFWLKARAGWREASTVNVNVHRRIDEMSYDELGDLIATDPANEQ